MTFFANCCVLSSKEVRRSITLICCWVAGLIVGYCYCEPYFLPLMHSAVLQPVSIVGLLACIFLPLICSYFSFLTDKPVIIMIVCFIKAVAFGFSGSLISQCFYTASWMIRFLFLFSDCCVMLLLWILWLRRFSNSHITGMKDISVCAVLCAGIAAADYFLISPIMLRLF